MTVYIVTNCYGITLDVYATLEDALREVRGEDDDNDQDVITEWEVR